MNEPTATAMPSLGEIIGRVRAQLPTGKLVTHRIRDDVELLGASEPTGSIGQGGS